jgi:hypothetical protein
MNSFRRKSEIAIWEDFTVEPVKNLPQLPRVSLRFSAVTRRKFDKNPPKIRQKFDKIKKRLTNVSFSVGW